MGVPGLLGHGHPHRERIPGTTSEPPGDRGLTRSRSDAETLGAGGQAAARRSGAADPGAAGRSARERPDDRVAATGDALEPGRAVGVRHARPSIAAEVVPGALAAAGLTRE